MEDDDYERWEQEYQDFLSPFPQRLPMSAVNFGKTWNRTLSAKELRELVKQLREDGSTGTDLSLSMKAALAIEQLLEELAAETWQRR